MIPYSRPKLSDLYTLSQGKQLENHTLHSGTYLYSPYLEVPPPASPPGFGGSCTGRFKNFDWFRDTAPLINYDEILRFLL